MRWQGGRRSDNVEDRRGAGGGGLRLGGLSGGTIVVALLASWALGVNPMEMLGIMLQVSGDLPVEERGGAPPEGDEQADFVRAILGDTEDTWAEVLSARGATYRP